jgi:hypothetical protein
MFHLQITPYHVQTRLLHIVKMVEGKLKLDSWDYLITSRSARAKNLTPAHLQLAFMTFPPWKPVNRMFSHSMP